MTLWFIAQGTADPLFSPLTQLGALGILAAFLTVAVRTLFTEQTKSKDLERATHAEALKTERARADRLESELKDLNRLIQEKILTQLTEANRMLALAIESDRRREGA